MENNVYLSKQDRNIIKNPSVTSMIQKQIDNATFKPTLNNNTKNIKPLIELEEAPEVEFASDKRKRIARNIMKLYGFSHGGSKKNLKKKKKR